MLELAIVTFGKQGGGICWFVGLLVVQGHKVWGLELRFLGCWLVLATGTILGPT